MAGVVNDGVVGRSLWPLVSLGKGLDVGELFDGCSALPLSLHRDPVAEAEFDNKHEVWTDASDQIDVFVHKSRVVGVTSHDAPSIHGQSIVGLSSGDFIRAFGKPDSMDVSEGVGTADYDSEEWSLTIGFWENKVSWATLRNLSYLSD